MSQNNRQKPYNSNNQTWKMILDNINIIPMNNRQYEWPIKEINKFMNDIFEFFENTNYCEKMGTIIYYSGNADGKEIYDGQQRTITTIIILIAISRISEINNDTNFSNLIISHISENPIMISKSNKRIDELIQKHGTDIKIPKVYCIWPPDDEALFNIYNNYKPLFFYINNKEDNEEDDEDEDEDEDEEPEENYECKKCGTTCSRKLDFIKHLSNKHNYVDYSKNKLTNIYTAYEFICQSIMKKKYEIKNLIELYKFIIYNIDIQVCECYDLQYVSKIFDQENNRGIKVGSLDVIKNKILSNISNDKKEEIYKIWTGLKSTSHNVYTDYGQKIFNCAIQIYNKKIIRDFNQEEFFDKLINKDDKILTYNEIRKFILIVEKLFDIVDKISKDRYGRLMFTKKCCITWEGYMYLMLPIFYFSDNIDNKLIEIVVRWYFRNICQKTLTFNSLGYSNVFIEISNNFIRAQNYDYYSEIIKLFRKEKQDCIKTEFYEQNNIDKEWKKSSGSKAKMLLYFLQTKLNNTDNLPNLSHDLEHIHSDNKKNDLKFPSNVYKLGNLTIFESNNSEENCHKGNRSIKDRPFHMKKNEYQGSSNSITRELTKYTEFTEDTIIQRTKEIFQSLNKLTDY